MDIKQRLAIFDLDGTLVDSARTVGDIVNKHLRTHGRGTFAHAQYCAWMGKGLRNLAMRAYEESKSRVGKGTMPNAHVRPHFDRWYADIEDEYYHRAAAETAPYAGIVPMLCACKEHVHVAVLTNKIDAIAQKIVHALFPHTFDAVYGLVDARPPKPDPSSVQALMRLFNVSASACILIGDSEIDYHTAHNAHINFCAVSWGYRSIATLKSIGVQEYAHSSQELQAHIIHSTLINT